MKRSDLVRIIRNRSTVEPGSVMISRHAGERMIERGVNMRQVLTTLQKGRAVQDPTFDDAHESWKVKLQRLAAGDCVEVVVAAPERAHDLIVITVIKLEE